MKNDLAAASEQGGCVSEPRCPKCDAEMTSALQAAMCPRVEACEFWPEDEGSSKFMHDMRRGFAEYAAQAAKTQRTNDPDAFDESGGAC